MSAGPYPSACSSGYVIVMSGFGALKLGSVADRKVSIAAVETGSFSMKPNDIVKLESPDGITLGSTPM